MIKHVEKIEKFNKDRGLLERELNIDLENSFLLSEELETLDYKLIECDLGIDNIGNHDDFAKVLISRYGKEFKSKEDECVEYIDKVIDHYYFGIGGMLKIGLTPTQIEYLFECVEYANANKPKKNIDGKVIKDDKFIDPKEEIRKIVCQVHQKQEQ